MIKKKSKDKLTFIESLPLFFSSIKRVWQFDKKYVIFTLFVLILGTIPELISAFVNAIFNQRIVEGCAQYASYLYVYYPLLIAFIVSIIDQIFFGIWRWMETKAKDKITSALLHESIHKVAKVDFASYDNPEFYDKIQKGWSQDGELFINSASNIITSISFAVGLIAYTSILTFIDWKLFIVITLLRLCFMPLEAKTYNITYQLNNKLAEKRRKEQYHRSFFSKQRNVFGRKNL